MAQFDIKGFEELLAQVDRLGYFDDVAPEMMEAGMDVLEKEVIAEAEKHRDTGEMIESIRRTGLSKTANGSYYMCTRPTGYSSKQGKWKNARKGKGEGKGRTKVRNMEKLVWLEYGVKGRSGTPIVTKAIIQAEPGVMRAMREVFERKVGKM